MGPDTLAIQFLAELARLPYKDADPGAAERFVRESSLDYAETAIGSARLTLSGPAGARSLDIVALGAQ